MRILLISFLLYGFSSYTFSLDSELSSGDQIEDLTAPVYSPFIERYVLDELKQLRIDQANARHEIIQQIVDREKASVDRGVDYATSAITYFFYLIAAATSLLVLVGWSSLREIKEGARNFADKEISKVVQKYEKRLLSIEDELEEKRTQIEENREEIEMTQEIQSLWLRAQQDSSPANKITVYDELLKLRRDDCEALTYKADAVLELNEPQWAINLCQQALKIDPDNSHAFYQLACAYTVMEQFEEAVRWLAEALRRSDSYVDEIRLDPALTALVNNEVFDQLTNLIDIRNSSPKKAESGRADCSAASC